jgi:hypothetical protein
VFLSFELQNSFLLVIPQGIEYALDFSEMTLIDTKNPLSPSAEMVRMEVKEHSAQVTTKAYTYRTLQVYDYTQTRAQTYMSEDVCRCAGLTL